MIEKPDTSKILGAALDARFFAPLRRPRTRRVGGEHADYDIEGIGNDFVPDTMDMKLVDEVVKVSDEEAFGATRELARREGIVAGSSSGGALAAALKAIDAGLRGNVVALFPDRGDRYFTKGLFAA